MSEESSSTPLRLKPKLKAEAEKAAAMPGGEPRGSPPPGGEEESAGRLKLKPRSASAATPPAPMPPPPPLAPPVSAESKVRLKPRLTPQEEQEAVREATAPAAQPEPAPAAAVSPPAFVPAIAPDTPPSPAPAGFKLKPKTASEEPPPLPQVSVPAPVTAAPPPASPEPVAAPPPKMRVKPPPELVASFSGGTAPGLPKAQPRSRRPVLTLLLVIVLIGGGGYYGYFGYKKFIAPASQPETAAPATPPPEGPASLPGRMISKAQEAASAQENRLGDLDELQRDAPAATAPAANDAGVMAAMPPRVEAPPPPPEPSEAFTRFVSGMRISGVFQGEPPRALINGRTVRAGEPIDLGLGIIFVGIDADRRLLLMREPSGALAAKKY